MKFQSNINEVLFIAEITPLNKYMFNQDLKTGWSVVWNSMGAIPTYAQIVLIKNKI